MLVRLEAAADAPVQARTLTVDLRALRVDTPWGEAHAFEVEPLRREGLLEGLDAIGLTLRRGEAIDRFQAWQRQARPWVYRS
jgi:3-isopropylmalate/(R)-2-methylmalate dehydratase small subunit